MSPGADHLTLLAFLDRILSPVYAVSLAIKLELEVDGLTVEKRQGAGALQDADANDCGFRVREASWTAVAPYRSYGGMAMTDKMRGVAGNKSFNAGDIFRQNFPNSVCAVGLAIKPELEVDW
jgi:hypothetical protein